MLLAVLLLGCEKEVNIIERSRMLDSYTYVDAGALAPADRQSFIVPLFSEGDGEISIFEIAINDLSTGQPSDVFSVADSAWQNIDCDDDGEVDCRMLAGYDEDSDEDTLALPVVFAPTAEGYYSAEMTIWSNDNRTEVVEPLPDDPDRSLGIWKVQLRGLSRQPCAQVTPEFIDFGAKAVGGDFPTYLEIENCGVVKITVASSEISGSGVGSFSMTTPTPIYILPGTAESLTLNYNVGSALGVLGYLSFVSNADDLDSESIMIIGNDCANSVSDSFDADHDGWSACGGDCDDTDSTINPSTTERASTNEDEDCDGEIDEAANVVSTDDDADGCDETGGGDLCDGGVDCNDADALIGPHATETINNIDDDCNGDIDDATERFDDDGDGYSEREGDCDDSSALFGPQASETPDGSDNDCDGITDEGSSEYDDDQDGTTEQEGDCDDGDPWVYVGAFEFCDGYDNDCDGAADEGADDTVSGACAFLPERDEDGDTGAVAAPSGCSTTGTGSGLVSGLASGLLIGLALLTLRRDRRV